MGIEARIIFWTSLIVGALLLFSLVKREKSEAVKLFIFWGMVIPVIFTTVFLAAATVIKNQTSVTKGPVHWHADYQIFICGVDQTPPTGKSTEVQPGAVDLLNPRGISNRIGTPDLHEHG